MSKGKWFGDLTPDTPLADAARRVVTVRLEVVRDYLGQSLRKPEKDPEYVHQLRVGTRRTGAALKAFKSCFAKKALRCARNQMRDLRRAAGGARDWDVFLIKLRKSADALPAEMQSGLDFLYGFATGQRLRAQIDLDAAFPNFPFSFDKFLTDTASAVRKRGDSTMGQLAAVAVPQAVDDLNRGLSQDLSNEEQLHATRLMGKRLRYAMEMFSGCFEPEFKKSLYPLVGEMQTILGDANDAQVAIPRYANLLAKVKPMHPGNWRRYAPLLEHLLEEHRAALPGHLRRFDEWLAKWNDLGGTPAFTKLLLKSSPPSAGKPMSEGPAETNAAESPPAPVDTVAPTCKPTNGNTPEAENLTADRDPDAQWSGVISDFLG